MATPTRVEIVGLPQVLRKLRSLQDEVLAAEYRAGLEEAARAAKASIASLAPVRTGKLRASLKHRLQASPIPRYAVIKTTATRSSARYRRYSYPRRLEFDPRSRHRNFFLFGLMRTRGRVQSILSQVARKIERRWGSR